MSGFAAKGFITICFIGFLLLSSRAQDVVREVSGSSFELINRSGRVLARTEASLSDKNVGTLEATSPDGVSDSEIKVTTVAGRTSISVIASDPKKRIDLNLILPERTSIKIETTAGGIEVMGNFAAVTAKTETGTIAVDVPTEDLTYKLRWTESRPRYLADFEIAEVKEKTAGRFEIQGRQNVEVKNRESKITSQHSNVGNQASNVKSEGSSSKDERSKTKDHGSKNVLLNLTTARGIILLNVPPNEVMSDLRERPLTNAAKAIIRSGDSLLMEAIRRASPKYFGDYARTLPPITLPPSLVVRGEQLNPKPEFKRALIRVTDLKNIAITDLTADEIEVLENNKSCEIVSFTRSTAPFNLVLLLDVSGSVENYVNFIRRTAKNFVETVDQGDRVSIITFNDDVKVLSKFSTDKQELLKSLDSFDAGGATAYYDAVAYVIADTLRPMKGERTAIVILTDGDDNRSFLSFESLIGSIEESGALIYPIYVPSSLIAAAAAHPKADIDPVRRKYLSLSVKAEGEGERLARVSGGVYYPITDVNQIQRAYDDIVVQLRTAYNVTFRSNSASMNNGISPRLKIRNKRPNTITTVINVVTTQ